MSMPVWCELVCRECAKRSAGRWTHSGVPRAKLKTDAKKIGFQFKHGEVFCSHRCLNDYEQNKEGTDQ